jgi:uncharacterized LabA/DUF88 family protein
MKRIAIMIDGSNAYASAKALDFKIDYVRFLSYFKKKYDVNRALYFTALPPKPEVSTLRNMTTFLEHNGYTLVTKDSTTYTDRFGVTKRKGNMDCEMVVSMIKYADIVEEILLFSGDGDFRCAVQYVQEIGCRVSVLSTLKGEMVSDSLRRQADGFIDLADLRDEIEHTTNRVMSSSREVNITLTKKRFFT